MTEHEAIQVAIQTMGERARDPALRQSYASMLRKFAPELVEALCQPVTAPAQAFPAFERVTAVESSIFDNWPNGKVRKGKPHRYAATIKVWTGPSKKINFAKPEAKYHVTLYSADALRSKVPDLLNPRKSRPISPEFASTLLGIADAAEASGGLAGPLMTKGSGTDYHDGQVMLVDAASVADRTMTGALILSGAETMALPTFSSMDAARRALTSYCVLQSRHSTCERLKTNWCS